LPSTFSPASPAMFHESYAQSTHLSRLAKAPDYDGTTRERTRASALR
jgi:hypothetical protein